MKKETPGDIIIWQMCTKNRDHMVYGSWDMVCDRWTDGQMHRQMEKVTYRDGCPTQEPTIAVHLYKYV